MAACNEKTEVYSRVVGYFRPVQQWNIGKKEEYDRRLEFKVDKADPNIIEELPAEQICTAAL